MTRKAQQRLRTAERKLSSKMQDLLEMEADLEEEILEIDAEWRKKADDVDTLDIGLEKTDISVDEVAIIWIPRD